ncbi:hypothetical protein D3C76_1553890 [compost metagenome]
MPLTRCTLSTMAFIVWPASCTSCAPVATFSTEASIRLRISLAAVALRWASMRTSAATTANPRPCSPAPAASTAALSARMLVWKAMPSITLEISAIFLALAWMVSIVVSMCCMASPPALAVREASLAS